MPNWCYNDLKVKGHKARRDAFHDKFIKDGFDAFVPMPKELANESAPVGDEKKEKEFLKKYGAKNWYDWANKNWGTKWNIYSDELSVNREEDFDQYGFYTAWAPPTRWLEKVAEMYPELEFEVYFEEPGIGFFGIAKFSDGDIEYIQEYNWEDRFHDGWWLFSEKVDLCNVFDDLMWILEDDDETDKKLLKELSETFKCSMPDDVMREFLIAMEDRDEEAIKELIKKCEPPQG